MKANELRIGNYVTDEWYPDFDTIIRVESINGSGVNLFIEDDGNYPECSNSWMEPTYRLDQLRAIPLTEEWLLKFGFDFFPNSNEWFRRYDISKSFKTYFCMYCGEGYYYIDGWDTRIEYVHQLQNLYFALTGEELTIKEKP